MKLTVPIPRRMQGLPLDPRGYPIPWNVLRGTDHTPLFTVNDGRKHLQAITEGRCPICGERLGRWKWFIGGPLSAFDEHGWYQDLPAHLDCATFALATCPYLAAPKYLGRIDVVDVSKLPCHQSLLIDHTMIPERPLLFVAVASDRVELQDGPLELTHMRPARPAMGYQFWRHGARIELAEALPLLRQALGAAWELPEVAR